MGVNVNFALVADVLGAHGVDIDARVRILDAVYDGARARKPSLEALTRPRFWETFPCDSRAPAAPLTSAAAPAHAARHDVTVLTLAAHQVADASAGRPAYSELCCEAYRAVARDPAGRTEKHGSHGRRGVGGGTPPAARLGSAELAWPNVDVVTEHAALTHI